MLTHIDNPTRAIGTTRSHHASLVAGIAMLSVAGCAVGADAPGSGGAGIFIDARDHRGADGSPTSYPAGDPSTRIVEGSILTLGDNNPATRIGDGVFPARLSDSPFNARPAALHTVAGELSLVTGAWRDTLTRVATVWAVKAEALPPVQVHVDSQMNQAVRNIVAQNIGTDPANVRAEKSACDLNGGTRCADEFVYTVMSFNGEFGAALMPLARHLGARASDIRMVLWTPMSGGVSLPDAITLYGHYDNRLVGVVVFR